MHVVFSSLCLKKVNTQHITEVVAAAVLDTVKEQHNFKKSMDYKLDS